MVPVGGGISTEAKDADENVQQICDKVKPHVEEKAGKAGKDVDVTACSISLTTKCAKRCYLTWFMASFQIHIGGDDHIHLRVWKKLPCNGGDVELSDMQDSKSHHDPIEYF
uniref:Cystatin-B-like n=1 Tax=Fundulus heteroclitus TaxID=8078 RepID=A0A3Q2PSB9_FUNHE